MESLEAMDIDSVVCPSPHSLSAALQLCEFFVGGVSVSSAARGGGHGLILKTRVGSCPRNGETPLCHTL